MDVRPATGAPPSRSLALLSCGECNPRCQSEIVAPVSRRGSCEASNSVRSIAIAPRQARRNCSPPSVAELATQDPHLLPVRHPQRADATASGWHCRATLLGRVRADSYRHRLSAVDGATSCFFTRTATPLRIDLSWEGGEGVLVGSVRSPARRPGAVRRSRRRSRRARISSRRGYPRRPTARRL